MLSKKTISADGSEIVYYTEYPENSTPVTKVRVNGRNVESHSKTDSFGRKVFDEIQTGTGFISRQFSYHAGKVTDEHKQNGKLKSSPTTSLVSGIVLSNGTTLSYAYDAEEHITSVTETYEVDGVPVVKVTSYTYDALGQLLTETVNGITTKFQYDNYGNILAKGVVDENGDIIPETNIEYTYDEVWKDKLTSFNGQSITYDAQGNPLNYLGHTLTWEKGRQLKSFDNIQYTYNANGIRTSKTVDCCALHEYVLEGSKIVKESWNGNTLVPLYDNGDSVCGITYNGIGYFFLKNLQGDIIAITDRDGDTVARYSYDAWGKCTILQNSSEHGAIASINPFRYRGYYYDRETELYYLQSRYYDPEVCRFVNADYCIVAMFGDTLLTKNLFAYCCNNSVINLDVNGFYTASSLKKKSWLFKLASNFGINISCINKTVEKQFFRVNLWLVKLIFSVSVGKTKNYKAGISFNFTKKSIGVSANLGMGAGYSLAFAYALSWTNITRSISLVYAAKNDGVYVSFDVEFQINHLATAAVAAACVYWPALSPVLYQLLAKSKAAALGAMTVLAPIVRYAYV